jgi:hypothetical protein
MGKMISAKINLEKIKDDLLYVGEKGTYLNLTIWINEDKPDKYGNTISIQQTTKKNEPKNYLGEGKFVEKKEEEQSIEAKGEWRGKVGVKSMSDPKDLPGADIVPDGEEPLF